MEVAVFNQSLDEMITESVRSTEEESLACFRRSLDLECEAQRINSDMPEIPVISDFDMMDIQLLTDKLNAYKTNYFFFLKSHENAFDQIEFPSRLCIDDAQRLIEIIADAMNNEMTEHEDIIKKWLESDKTNSRIRILRTMSEDIEGEVVRYVGETPTLQKTNKYVLILEKENNEEEFPIRIVNIYPV